MSSLNPQNPAAEPASGAAYGLDRRRFLAYLAGGSTLAVAAAAGLGTLRGPATAGAAIPGASGSPAPSGSPSPTGSAPASTKYEVIVTMSQDTVAQLSKNGFYLYGFKAVQGGSDGVPLVWFQTKKYLAKTTIDWTEDYQAYIAEADDIPNGHIDAETSLSIDLDQTMTVAEGGICSVADGGTAGAITVYNTSDTEYATGISLVNNGVASPICAFPLFGGGTEDVIAPIEKVLLMFSTTPVNTGTVVEQAYSSGILIDLTGATSRTVSFDINGGWSWGGQTWATAVAPQEKLVPLLIDSSS